MKTKGIPNYLPLDVIATESKMPAYIRKAKKIKHICFGGFDKDGRPRKDIGAAMMRNGEVIGFWWGDNLSMGDIQKIRHADHCSEFVYIGQVWDGESASRDNFARVINF